jgi:hypothetical protein
MLAAANLGKIDHPVALGILSANVGMVDDAIRAVIITSLGRIGNLDTLSLLSSQDHQGQGGLSSSAIRFAMTLLSYRFRVPGHELVLPEENEYVEAPNDGGFRLALTEANEAEAEYCLRCLAAKPFGIELSDSRIYQLRCWHNLSLVALNRDFVTEDAASRLAAGPAFLGLVAAADPETGTYHPTNLLLTSPGDPTSELNIFVCRLRGQITLAGGSTLDRSGISFVIRAVAHPGVRPTTIRGIFERGKLRMPSASATMYVRDKVSCSEARGV